MKWPTSITSLLIAVSEFGTQQCNSIIQKHFDEVNLLQIKHTNVHRGVMVAERPTMFVAIFSRAEEVNRRNSLRSLWHQIGETPLNFVRKFVVCNHGVTNLVTQEGLSFNQAMQNEAAKHGDMSILSCPEAYSELQHKLVETMEAYLASYSKVAPLFMKTDIDTFVHWHRLATFLMPRYGPHVYIGVNTSTDKVVRNHSCGWHESYAHYPHDTYPWTMAGGPGYILGRSLVTSVLKDIRETDSLHFNNEDRFLAVRIDELKKRGVPVKYMNVPGTTGYSKDDVMSNCEEIDNIEAARLDNARMVALETWRGYPYILHHHLDSRSVECLSQAMLDDELDRKLEVCFPKQVLSLMSQEHDRRRPVLTAGFKGRTGNILFELATLLSVASEAKGRFSVAIPRQSFHLNPAGSPMLFSLQGPLFKNVQHLMQEDVPDTECQQQHIVENWGLEGHSLALAQKLNNSDEWARSSNWAAMLLESVTVNAKNCKAAPVVQLEGYFQDQRYFGKHLGFLREVFLEENALRTAAEALDRLAPRAENMVSIHYRFGDYVTQALAYQLPKQFYHEAMQVVQHRIPAPLTCVVFSDDPRLAEEWSRDLAQCKERVVVPADIDADTSFFMMSLVPNSVVADSSYSFWSALLGRNKSLVVAPAVDDWKFAHLKQQPGWVTVKTTLHNGTQQM